MYHLPGKFKHRRQITMRNIPRGKRRFLAIGFSLAIVASLALALTAFVSPFSAHAAAKYVPSGNGKQQNVTVWLTWYGYNDNSGETENQHGSAAIAYPKSDGYPTLHNHATEGKGTYTDPVTFAAPNKDLKTTFPIGSIIYVPLVKKYFIMEDQCGDDDPQGCQHGTNHVDLWMGHASASNATKLDYCEGKATPDNTVQVVINPSSSLSVDTTTMFKNNKCTIKLYN